MLKAFWFYDPIWLYDANMDNTSKGIPGRDLPILETALANEGCSQRTFKIGLSDESEQD